MSNYCYIDFEFRGTKEEILDLVCCSLYADQEFEEEEYWLFRDDSAKAKLKDRLYELIAEGCIFVSHGVIAEARSFLSLGINPLCAKFIDTFLEFRQDTNFFSGMYGKHLIDGKVKEIRKIPKWSDESSGGKLNHSLSQAIYYYLGRIIDTEEKEYSRLIIINGSEHDVNFNKERIINYCTSDIKNLPDLWKKVKESLLEVYNHIDININYLDVAVERGRVSSHCALIETRGYPVDRDKVRNFTRSTGLILAEIQADINRQFPNIKPFHFDKKSYTFTQKVSPIRKWISENMDTSKWLKTDKGELSLSLEAWEEHFHFRHSYPEGDFGAQMLRFLKTKQSMYGFTKAKSGKDKKSFIDSIGSDGNCRAYLNPFGSATSRYQPPSTSFLFLKAAWLRSLCHPPKGKMIVGIDYKSEEFLISGLMSGDRKMIDAYASGDVYMAFAKASGLVPMDATKHSHPEDRQAAKASVLGQSFDMTKIGLAVKMSQDLGRKVTEDEAQRYIDLFQGTYSTLFEWKRSILEWYDRKGYLMLKDHWVLGPENDNHRSVGNMPIQGTGGAILRKAISMLEDVGLEVIIPLHDAVYCLIDANDWASVELFAHVMKDAFRWAFDNSTDSGLIQVDIEAWGDDLEEGELKVGEFNVETSKIHIDERSKKEYEKFNKYFNTLDIDLI